MKAKHFTYLLVFLVLASCYSVDKPAKPANLLTEDKMVDVLVEMSLMYSAKAINKRELEKHNIVPEAFIYEKHNIDSLQFAESNYYYAFDIKKYDKIYKSVKDSLEKLKTKYKAIQDEEQRVKDSIKKTKVKPKTTKPEVKRDFQVKKDSLQAEK